MSAHKVVFYVMVFQMLEEDAQHPLVICHGLSLDTCQCQHLLLAGA